MNVKHLVMIVNGKHKAEILKRMLYDKYRGRFRKVMKAVEITHNPHETRHTFITQAKYCNVNEYILKKIIGHEISNITESVYTHRSIETYIEEIAKIVF